MKVANPLQYPLAVLAGGILLVVGVRLIRLPSAVVLPVAAVGTVAGASWLRSREPETFLENPELQQALLQVQQQAQTLVTQSQVLQAEAQRLLTQTDQMELLGTVQYVCDRTRELPAKIDQLARRLQGKDSLLSVADLQKQLSEAEAKQHLSSGVAREQWSKLVASLSRNIELAKQGEDARQAQVVSLSTLIFDGAALLQQLQNKLRTANLSNAAEADELRLLSHELSSVQENVDLLVS